MRIGIITFWQSNDNYGQILQCKALQQCLLELGHSPYLIKYDFENRRQKLSFKKLVKKILKFILIFPIIISHNRETKFSKRKQEQGSLNEKRKFIDFKNKYILSSHCVYHSLKELKQNPPLADAYITGSDQVWAQLLDNNENKVFFLDFGNRNTKRISYAPSFALEEYPRDLLGKLKNQLSIFDFISIREETGRRILGSIGVEADLVLDPTLLLTINSYQPLLKQQKFNNYIYIYSLNIQSPDEICFSQLLESISDKKIVVTTASGICQASEIFDNVLYDYSTIEDWLTNIRYADLFVTSSFHGIVFAIILHTNFVFVPLKGHWAKMNNRVLDLLNSIGLSDRCLFAKNDYKTIISQSINWRDVDCKLDHLRKKSVLFLNKALQQ